jgi:hypothetical protein
MEDETPPIEIPIGRDSIYTKNKKGDWIDKKSKSKAPAGLIGLLNTVASKLESTKDAPDAKRLSVDSTTVKAQESVPKPEEASKEGTKSAAESINRTVKENKASSDTLSQGRQGRVLNNTLRTLIDTIKKLNKSVDNLSDTLDPTVGLASYNKKDGSKSEDDNEPNRTFGERFKQASKERISKQGTVGKKFMETYTSLRSPQIVKDEATGKYVNKLTKKESTEEEYLAEQDKFKDNPKPSRLSSVFGAGLAGAGQGFKTIAEEADPTGILRRTNQLAKNDTKQPSKNQAENVTQISESSIVKLGKALVNSIKTVFPKREETWIKPKATTEPPKTTQQETASETVKTDKVIQPRDITTGRFVKKDAEPDPQPRDIRGRFVKKDAEPSSIIPEEATKIKNEPSVISQATSDLNFGSNKGIIAKEASALEGTIPAILESGTENVVSKGGTTGLSKAGKTIISGASNLVQGAKKSRGSSIIGKKGTKLGSKLLGSLGKEKLAKFAGKEASTIGTKAIGKTLGKSLLKKIPGVGLLAGLALGANRLLHGDITGAVGEFASGAASTIPGIGTAASVGIDTAIAARDVAQESSDTDATSEPNMKAAKGAVFADGGVVDKPTLFSHTGGKGLMGEAGPEAIIPLHRGSDGKLGVQNIKGPDVDKKTEDLKTNTSNNTYMKESKMAPISTPAPSMSNISSSSVVNNNQNNSVNLPTAGSRGSLNIAAYA